MQRIRILIAVPEPFLRRRVRDLVRAERDFEIVSECSDAAEVPADVHRLHPDALLIDTSLPRGDALELVRRLDADRGPAVVFLAGEEGGAQEAFDAGAVDCIRKPVEDQRLARALLKVRTWVRAEGAARVSERLSELLRELRTAADYPSRIPVSADGRLLFLPVHEIDWIDGSGNYVCLRAGGRAYRLRNTLSALERSLDPGRFRRIHRGVIVNLARIQAVEPKAGGSAIVHLYDGTALRLSRGYRYVLSWLGSESLGSSTSEELAAAAGAENGMPSGAGSGRSRG